MTKSKSTLLWPDFKGIQLCYCGPVNEGHRTALPFLVSNLNYHSLGCIAWDHALACRDITAETRMDQLNRYDQHLKDTYGPEAQQR